VKKIKIYFDGASRGNPGIAGAGWVIKIDNEKFTGSKYIGKMITNNQAEYYALIYSLEEAKKHIEQKTQLIIRGDSELIIRQLKGEYAVRSPKIKPLYDQVKPLLNNFHSWSCEWIPREENTQADALANHAIEKFK
jgi:ribonuclease HI